MAELKTVIFSFVVFLTALSVSSFIWYCAEFDNFPEEISYETAKRSIEKGSVWKATLNHREYLIGDFSNIELTEVNQCLYAENKKFRVYDDYWRRAELFHAANNSGMETSESGFYSSIIFEAGISNLSYFFLLPIALVGFFMTISFALLKRVLH